LILLDIKMPILDGVELCKKIREVDKSIRIIFITASGEFYKKIREERYPELINYNSIRYIQKPIANEELIKVVNTMMYASDTNQNKPLPKQRRNKMEIDYDFSAQ
jgi:two-component SAPR family response regulator